MSSIFAQFFFFNAMYFHNIDKTLHSFPVLNTASGQITLNHHHRSLDFSSRQGDLKAEEH